jgi:hypothetical protein
MFHLVHHPQVASKETVRKLAKLGEKRTASQTLSKETVKFSLKQ